MPDLTTWLVSTSTAAALAVSGWGLLGTVTNSERIAVVETEIKRLPRIEEKIDKVTDLLLELKPRQEPPQPRKEPRNAQHVTPRRPPQAP